MFVSKITASYSLLIVNLHKEINKYGNLKKWNVMECYCKFIVSSDSCTIWCIHSNCDWWLTIHMTLDSLFYRQILVLKLWKKLCTNVWFFLRSCDNQCCFGGIDWKNNNTRIDYGTI